MGNSQKKRQNVEHFMETRRNIGVPSGQIVSRDPITPDLFMKVGTITAYCQHVPQNTSSTQFTNPSLMNSSVSPAVKTPIVTKLPELESTTPFADTVTYLSLIHI